MRIQFNVLKKLGLTDNEVRIYLACLEFGAMSVGQIVQKIDTPRSTINDTVKKLLVKGYLSISVEGKKRMYIPATIDQLATLQEKQARDNNEKADMLRKHVLDFQEIQKRSFVVPHVKFYQGKDATEIIYNYVYETSTYYAFFSSDDIVAYASEYDKMIVNHLKEKNIPHKIFTTDTANGSELIKYYTSLGLNAKLLPKEISISTDNIILDNKFLYISYNNDKITAIEIKDEMFAKSQRAIFDAAWKMFK